MIYETDGGRDKYGYYIDALAKANAEIKRLQDTLTHFHNAACILRSVGQWLNADAEPKA